MYYSNDVEVPAQFFYFYNRKSDRALVIFNQYSKIVQYSRSLLFIQGDADLTIELKVQSGLSSLTNLINISVVSPNDFSVYPINPNTHNNYTVNLL